MQFRLVSENEFLKSILSELDERFKERVPSLSFSKETSQPERERRYFAIF
jgi:hypothetical protein